MVIQRRTNNQISRRQFLKAMGALAGTSLVWSACAVPPQQTAAPPAQPQVTTAPIQEPIIIGHQPEVTGVASVFGFWNDRAAQAAAKRINDNGGIAGRPVKLVTRDTGSNPDQGLDAMRRLILEDKADFVLGSIIADINKPSAALAAQLETLYFPSDDVPVKAGQPEANRFVFRLGHNTRIKAQAAFEWGLENLGTKWSFLSSDTTWGRAQVEDFSRLIQTKGGQVIDTVFAPLLTQDFVPLFNQIDLDATEVLYHTFFGSASVRFNSQAAAAGVFDKVKVFASIGVIEGLPTTELPDGQAYITEFPRRLSQIPEELQEFNKTVRDLIGVDDEGNEIGGNAVLTGEHYWVPWVNMHLIKQAVELSGWKNKADNMALIETLEGFEAKASLDFPSGDFVIRPQDHRAFRDYFIEQTQGGKLVVVARLPKELGFYDPPVDYTKM